MITNQKRLQVSLMISILSTKVKVLKMYQVDPTLKKLDRAILEIV